MADNVAATPGTGVTLAFKDVDGVKHQRVVVEAVVAGVPTDVSTAAPFPVTQVNVAATGTAAVVTATAGTGGVVVLAANAGRKGAIFYNDSGATLYLLFSATGTVSATNFSIAVPGYNSLGEASYYELTQPYTGIVKGIWTSATGSVRVTEFA